ncbi:fibrillin [Scytonema tolypothrichoides VB-61278]|nr:fibrillin [Scytonema tolypothrichoides VB-61278]
MGDSTLFNLKQELISISTATDIGFNSNTTYCQQIEKLAQQIEVLNQNSEPTSHMELVQGRWRLLYSTFGLEQQTTLSRLSFGKLPNVTISVTGLFQEIYKATGQYNNLIEFIAGSGVKGVTVVMGRYTVVDSKRLAIDFLETSAYSATDDLNDAAFPEALGVDPALPLKSTLSGSGWVDITYLDADLRLMRGNQQNLYVLQRE